MSDLSFLIQNENEVQLDQDFLQKYQNQPTNINNVNPTTQQNLPSSKKQIKLKKKMTMIQSNKSKLPMKSFTTQNLPTFPKKIKKVINPEQPKSSDSSGAQNEKYFESIEKRIEQMMQNQKSIEEEISSTLFDVKYGIQMSDKSHQNLTGMIQKTKTQVKKTQKSIGQILSLIEKQNQNKNLKQFIS